MTSLKFLAILAVTTLVAACKLAVVVGAGGNAVSQSGTRNCLAGSSCSFNVTDTDFDESFTAVPKTGYVFSKWKSGDGYICGNSTSPTCVTSNTQFQGNTQVEAVIASDAIFKLEPIFEVTLNSLSSGLQKALAHLEQIKGLVPVVVDATGKSIGVLWASLPTIYDGEEAVLVKFNGVQGAHFLVVNQKVQLLDTRGETYFTGQNCTGDVYIGGCFSNGNRLSVCPVGLLESTVYAADIAAEPQNVFVQSCRDTNLGNENRCASCPSTNRGGLLPASPVEFGITFPIRTELR